MQATVWGGAGEHGRSCYLIEHRQTRILLDCGGKKEQGGIYPLYEESIVRQLDAVFLSHAHEDHSMALPLLYRMGYIGKVWTTRATKRQLPAYFAAWKQYAAGQQAELPYEDKDIDAISFAYIDDAVRPGEWLELSPGLSVAWGRSGHLAGSVWFLFDVEGERVFYSGDYTAESGLLEADDPAAMVPLLPVLRPSKPSARSGTKPCLSIVEAAYGTDEEEQEALLDRLERQIRETLLENAWVLLPVPTYGRGQELMVWAQETFPGTPLLVERELMTALGELLAQQEWLREGAAARLERFMASPHIQAAAGETERQAAIASAPAGIIFTNDGMMQSAKCRRYYELLREQGRYAVILTGHLARGSFGERLLQAEQELEKEERQPDREESLELSQVPNQEPHPERCHEPNREQPRSQAEPQARERDTLLQLEQGTESVPKQGKRRVHFVRYKVHQGLPDVRRMLGLVQSGHTLLVHAGKRRTDALVEKLRSEGAVNLHSLAAGDTLKLPM